MWERSSLLPECLPPRGLVRCRQGPSALLPAVISWLSSGKETAKQGTVYLRRLCSLHIPAFGLRHRSNLPGSAEKRPADLLSTTVCTEETGVQINRWQRLRSVRHHRANKANSPHRHPP
ncbi:hypothetical protein CRENBAI_013927 [Crenichthys baileyi]|uniref:Uncharacterized protein n=1 Tax=Crenichthys baileyi TaxID=28760 RepID=A0AAV9SE47_9TELE